MKKMLFILIALMLSMPFQIEASDDYSFLDGMTLEELTKLNEEIEARITDLEKAEKPTSTSDSADMGIWQIKYYVDEFQMPTDKGYITTYAKLDGTFSNSATTNSSMSVYWLIDKDSVSIQLYEYGVYEVNSPYDTTEYSIAMLDSDENRTDMTGHIYKGGDRITFDNEYEQTVIDALKAGGDVIFKFTEKGKFASSSYLLKMEWPYTHGFDAAYDALISDSSGS